VWQRFRHGRTSNPPAVPKAHTPGLRVSDDASMDSRSKHECEHPSIRSRSAHPLTVSLSLSLVSYPGPFQAFGLWPPTPAKTVWCHYCRGGRSRDDIHLAGAGLERRSRRMRAGHLSSCLLGAGTRLRGRGQSPSHKEKNTWMDCSCKRSQRSALEQVFGMDDLSASLIGWSSGRRHLLVRRRRSRGGSVARDDVVESPSADPRGIDANRTRLCRQDDALPAGTRLRLRLWALPCRPVPSCCSWHRDPS
jgi:hypothetical protein